MERTISGLEQLQVFSWTCSLVCFVVTWLLLHHRHRVQFDWPVITSVGAACALCLVGMFLIGAIGLISALVVGLIAVSVVCLSALCYYRKRWSVIFLSAALTILLNSVVLSIFAY